MGQSSNHCPTGYQGKLILKKRNENSTVSEWASSEYYQSILGLQEDSEGCRRLLEKTGGYMRVLHSCKRVEGIPKWKKGRLWYIT